MHSEQFLTETDHHPQLRHQFVEYLQQQEQLFQQRRQQTASLLHLRPESNSTERTRWDSSLNLLSDFPTSAPTQMSFVRSGTGSLSDADDQSPYSPLENQHYQDYFQLEPDDDETVDNDKGEEGGSGRSASKSFLEHDMPTTSDFVKKLYRMLTDERFHHIVCWGPEGDCFIVKDMQECTKFVLPRLFKHSNFSSFVRQLNKYSFHKIKTAARSGEYGENSWIFQHPDFREGHPEALENIKRKPSAPRKSPSAPKTSPPLTANASPASSLFPSTANSPIHPHRPFPLEKQTRFPPDARPTPAIISQDLVDRLTSLERKQEGILGELVGFQRGLAQRNEIIQGLISLSLGTANG